MATPNITLDAHSLIWYIDKQSNERLSRRALETIKTVEESAIIFVPIIALMEILHLIDAGRFAVSFDTIIGTMEENEAYQIVPLDMKLLEIAIPLKGLEIHDRLILATAILTNSVLVSRDRAIEAPGVTIVW
jgi:PIN domain nuclease of toxin-antitoxin system